MEGYSPMWERMSIDRYAELEKATGDTVVKLSGICWRQVRPFFYRPLLPFEIYESQLVESGFGKFAAFQHAVSNGQPHNSFLNLVIFDQLQLYNIMNLNKMSRKNLRRALKNNLTILRITDPEEFIEKAFPIYNSFYNRTRYFYRKNRTDKEKFSLWSQKLFSYSEVVVLGVFAAGKMISVEISNLVNDALILKSTISSDLALKLRVPELMLHFYRESTTKRPDIKMIYAGVFLKKEGINNFKIERGARVVALRAHLHINPLLLWSFKKLRKKVYQRLKGMNEKQLREIISAI